MPGITNVSISQNLAAPVQTADLHKSKAQSGDTRPGPANLQDNSGGLAGLRASTNGHATRKRNAILGKRPQSDVDTAESGGAEIRQPKKNVKSNDGSSASPRSSEVPPVFEGPKADSAGPDKPETTKTDNPETTKTESKPRADGHEGTARPDETHFAGAERIGHAGDSHDTRKDAYDHINQRLNRLTECGVPEHEIRDVRAELDGMKNAGSSKEWHQHHNNATHKLNRHELRHMPRLIEEKLATETDPVKRDELNKLLDDGKRMQVEHQQLPGRHSGLNPPKREDQQPSLQQQQDMHGREALAAQLANQAFAAFSQQVLAWVELILNIIKQGSNGMKNAVG